MVLAQTEEGLHALCAVGAAGKWAILDCRLAIVVKPEQCLSSFNRWKKPVMMLGRASWARYVASVQA